MRSQNLTHYLAVINMFTVFDEAITTLVFFARKSAVIKMC